MSRKKLFGLGTVFLLCVLLLAAVGSVYAGSLAQFDNPRVTACSLSGLTVSGTLRIGATVHVEEYLNDQLLKTFAGSAGTYSGYVAYYNADALPYTWRTVLSFKNSSGEIIEQYVLEGECREVNQGTVRFREVEVDTLNLNIG
jgi:hypothetical protein